MDIFLILHFVYLEGVAYAPNPAYGPALTATLKRVIKQLLGIYSITQVKYYKQTTWKLKIINLFNAIPKKRITSVLDSTFSLKPSLSTII